MDTCIVLEGLHALKHAIRFGAEIRLVVTPRPDLVMRLAEEVAGDLVPALPSLLTTTSEATFRALSDRPPASPVLALADRPHTRLEGVLSRGASPVVLLEQPRHAGNAGAVVRVAAAAGARAVLMTGALDPWAPSVVRASAGLHFALDVEHVDWPVATNRPLVALDPVGEELRADLLPGGCILAFGTERHGLSSAVLGAADAVLRLPMRRSVSSLNLATSVSAVLYSWRLLTGPDAWPLETEPT